MNRKAEKMTDKAEKAVTKTEKFKQSESKKKLRIDTLKNWGH